MIHYELVGFSKEETPVLHLIERKFNSIDEAITFVSNLNSYKTGTIEWKLEEVTIVTTRKIHAL